MKILFLELSLLPPPLFIDIKHMNYKQKPLELCLYLPTSIDLIKLTL